ncbi:MAG: saccharopine dehydrogenase NADP-binding domain-containing protein [Chloroflexota bacterium]
MNWMIYGVTGYTGRLVVEEAVKRGHQPIVAGRNSAKVTPIAQAYNLTPSIFSLDSVDTIAGELQKHNIELVMHIAGPYKYTSDPMIQACLQVGAHYLDITGEIDVYQNAYRYHQQADAKGIVVMLGVGFDVVPSDCLLKYVADQIDKPTHLEISFHNEGIASRGTLKSAVEIIRTVGNVVRRDGELVKIPFASQQKTIDFMSGKATVYQSMWGDVETGYRTTGIPNITTFFTFSDAVYKQLQMLNRAAPLLGIGFIRNFIKSQIDKLPEGPSEKMRETLKINLHAKATNAHGDSAEAWLETVEGYRFTALACLHAVEQVLDGNHKGALTPAQAFGADFVLGIEGTIRKDSLT